MLGMVVRVGINGFGRIGRVIFRTCVQSENLEVAAINDPAVDIDYICYLIKFDSTHGKFKSEVTFSEDTISIDGKKIMVFREKLPSSIPWQVADVQYVVEASGMFTSREKAAGHLASGSVKRVIITAPTVDVPMLILGVNEDHINAEQKVISCASSTLYCLAPIVKILEDKYGVAEGFITSIHAMTPSLKPLDGLCLKGKHWRDHRSIHQNIIPAATGACRALGKIIPAASDKLTGLAFRVPIVNVSVLDITVRLNKNTTIQNIIKCVEEESKSTMKNIIKVAKDQEVSSDFIGDQHSCIVDANSSLQLNPKFFKLICWYENEYSYACRVVDSIKYYEENIYKLTASYIIPSIKSPTKPIRNFNKEYIVSNCHISSNLKEMLSSQDTGIETEKPLEDSGFKQLVLRDSKQSGDISLACNQEADITVAGSLVKENKNCNLQSSSTLDKTFMQNNNYFKTKERLDKLKKEFSKVANMTEKLLKESNKNKCEANFLREELDSDEKKKDIKRELYSTHLSLPAVVKCIPTNAIFQKSISDNGNAFKANINEISNKLKIKNNSEYNNTPNINANGNQQVLNKRNNVSGNVKITDYQRRDCQDEQTNKMTEAVDDFDDQENLKPENKACIPIRRCAASLYNNKMNLVTNSYGHKADLWNFNLRTKEMFIHDSSHTKVVEIKVTRDKSYDKPIASYSDKVCKCTTKHEEIKQLNSVENKLCVTSSDDYTEKFNNVWIKYDEVKKFNNPQNVPDIISNKNKVKTSNKSDLNNTELPVTYINPESADPSKNEIRKKILVGIMKILAAKASENKTQTPSLVTSNSTSNRDIYKSLDIYDKLDSASASDSDNSFQINEKISQVIEITDLSSSVEELARLDKICRIIEISDEMSDKLFSALNNEENNTKKTKWSFKDLCERLKFDEFCNNVFGEPSSLAK